MLVMKNQPFHLTYIDAFAGVGVSKVRRSEPEEAGLYALIEEDDRDAADEFILGSPHRALGLERPFDHYHFVERDPRRVKLLGDLRGQYPRASINAVEDDANAAVQRIARSFTRWDQRGVAFLDPYGAHLHWKTLDALAATGKFDVIINFPLDMAINRFLKRDTQVEPYAKDQLDACFGVPDWYDESYLQEDGLFGKQVIKRPDARERLLKLYLARLKTTFGHVAGPSLVRNTVGGPLYHLLWASSNARGQGIAKHILDLGEAVAAGRGRGPKIG